ncbi:MAG TPA: Ig-like domain-containing protein [Myxococcota bacterium]|nr:Ig-like domain-containing protein [Myxococcota bacterium]HRY94169.1 Ig-like domain-containing protein [Myxococcota bacterium]
MNLTRIPWYAGLALALSLAACSDDVSGPNQPPVAVAGPDRYTLPGTPVTLDGSGSYDPDGDTLSGYEWTLLAAPAGSQASLDPAQARQPQVTFTPDIRGAYVFGLVVSDGQLASARDVAQVLAEDVPCTTAADCPDDGLWCTGTPECVDGGCVETPPDCTDADACTQDLCSEANDQCDHPPVVNSPPEDVATVGSCSDGVDNDCDGLTDGADAGCVACSVAGDCLDDGLWCTGTPDCVGGVCVETPPDCSDTDVCTQDLCDEELNQCAHPPVTDPPLEDLATAGSCTDGLDNDCDTLTDDADPGCASCEDVGDCPDDDDVCTGVDCVAGACQYPPANEGGACDDGLFCTDPDVCTAGVCGGPARDCSGAADTCNTGACDEQAGACVPVPVSNGTSCGPGDCQGLQWTGPTCENGACSGSDVQDCNDGSLCTDDSCDAAAGCGHAPAHEGEECGPRSCDALAWNRVVCQAGLCELIQLAEDCDDGNLCTDDACDAASGCASANNTLGCDDADGCTVGDTCQGGGCVGAPLDEDLDGYGPLNLGCGEDCDDTVFAVNPGVFEGPFGDAVCADGVDNDCDLAIDDLDSTCLQCQGDGECDNGDFCDGAETCVGGACLAGTSPCLPESECNHCNEDADSCFDPVATACGSPGDSACDDPDSCDGAGTCQPNLEDPGVACGDPTDTDCSDPDSCDGAGACQPNDEPIDTSCGNSNDTECDNPDSCNGAGLCRPNYVGSGTACGSASDTICTDPDSCDGSGVCQPNHAPPDTPCPDAAYCNGAERCGANGSCMAGTNPCLPESDCRHCNEDDDGCFDLLGAACGSNSDTACDDPDTCNATGTCLLNHETAGTSCADAFYCNGAEQCDADGACLPGANPCLPESDCNHCNEDDGSCFDPPGTSCGDALDTACTDPDSCDDAGVCLANHAAEFSPCPDALYCNGEESCDTDGACADRADPCPGTECNTCQEDGDSCFDPVGTVCGDQDDTECTKPDTCSGDGACAPNHATEGAACQGAMTEESCDSSCRSGVCDDGLPAADLTVCVDTGGSVGICCSAACRAGGECCAASDCDDLNGCTTDACSGTFVCNNICSDPNCMQLDVTSPADVGLPTPVTLDMCPAARDVSDLVCISSRNLDALFLYQNFEIDLSGFTTNGQVTRQVFGGNGYARICQNGSYLRVRLDTSGLKEIMVRATLSDLSMDNDEMVEVRYSLDAASWKALALIGDDTAITQGPTTFLLLLPAEADDASEVYIDFYQRGGDGSDCVAVDEVTIMAMLPYPAPASLLSADFQTGFAPFNEDDREPQDVERIDLGGGNWWVRLDDNTSSNIYSASIDTTGVDPYELLVLGWDWYAYGNHDNGDYFLVQYSVDNTNWVQLGAIGHVDDWDTDLRYRVLLPCEAYGVAGLRVRFIGPGSGASAASDGEGVYIDNVSLDVWRPEYLDVFGPFTDQTNGIYTGDMTSDPDGAFSVICRYGCTQWSNWDPVTVNP